MAERKGGNKIGNRRTNLLYHMYRSMSCVVHVVCTCATVKRVMCNCVTCGTCTMYNSNNKRSYYM